MFQNLIFLIVLGAVNFALSTRPNLILFLPSHLFLSIHILLLFFFIISCRPIMHSSFTLQVFYLITTLLVPAQAETYWVDTASCNGKLLAADGSSAIITEALRFASRAAIRNRSGAGDSNMARLFQRIWKVPQSDTDTNDDVECECRCIIDQQRVLTSQGRMESIGATTVSPTREAADVRIYCDDDETSKTGGASARWQLVPDRVTDPDGQKNSQKTTGQEWYDQVNFVRRSTDTNGCLDPNNLAETCECVHYGERVFIARNFQLMYSQITIQ